MSYDTWIYYIQAGFNNLVRLTVGGSFALTAWKLHYYFKDRTSETYYHRINHSEHSINLFKNKIIPKISKAYNLEHNKSLLNKLAQKAMNNTSDTANISRKYIYDRLPSLEQHIIKRNLKRNILSYTLNILEEWALGVLISPNDYHLIYLETHEDLLSFINHFKSEFHYDTMNMDKYRAIVKLYHKFQRSEKYEEN